MSATKQVVAIDEASLREFVDAANEAGACDFLRLLIPLHAGSPTHDKNCGSGAITKTLFELQPPPPQLHINSDDSNSEGVEIRVSVADKKPGRFGPTTNHGRFGGLAQRDDGPDERHGPLVS
ncbi:hypothetical protein PG985_014071 [Apiospora marii]|uniref:uncharacterized protein n=1 Tax=Apiospora marii TaxID=335849 RepID=UPI00312CC6A8